MRRWPWFLAACALALEVACAPPSSPGGNTERGRIAGLYKAKCGSCHTPVEPGSRSRDALEKALARHRKRLRLTEADWAKMVDYLSTSESDASPSGGQRSGS